jgi:hypothetical protein
MGKWGFSQLNFKRIWGDVLFLWEMKIVFGAKWNDSSSKGIVSDPKLYLVSWSKTQ